MTDAAEKPIAWRMTAVPDRPRLLDGHKAKPWSEDYADEVAATHRKRNLQAIGHVATVTPVYPSRKKVERANAALQDRYFACYAGRWKLHA